MPIDRMLPEWLIPSLSPGFPSDNRGLSIFQSMNATQRTPGHFGLMARRINFIRLRKSGESDRENYHSALQIKELRMFWRRVGFWFAEILIKKLSTFTEAAA